MRGGAALCQRESADSGERGYQAVQLVTNVQERCGACLSLHPLHRSVSRTEYRRCVKVCQRGVKRRTGSSSSRPSPPALLVCLKASV